MHKKTRICGFFYGQLSDRLRVGDVALKRLFEAQWAVANEHSKRRFALPRSSSLDLDLWRG
ncbi:MAG: hypothetical protein AAAB16_02240 [Pseudomonas sp.]